MKILAIYLALVNLLALIFCAADKARARRGAWRIPERTLLTLCALGGAPLFWVGMGIFRHKTRHMRFAVGVPVMTVIWVTIAILIFR